MTAGGPIRDLAEAHRILTDGIDWRELQAEWRRLVAVRDWALEQIHLAEGGPARIVGPVNTDNGWKPHVEALAPGATGVVSGLRVVDGDWHCYFLPDRCWTVTRVSSRDPVQRRWCGRASDCPEGMEPRGEYEQALYPDGRRHLFAMPMRWLAPPAPVFDDDTAGGEG